MFFQESCWELGFCIKNKSVYRDEFSTFFHIFEVQICWSSELNYVLDIPFSKFVIFFVFLACYFFFRVFVLSINLFYMYVVVVRNNGVLTLQSAHSLCLVKKQIPANDTRRTESELRIHSYQFAKYQKGFWYPHKVVGRPQISGISKQILKVSYLKAVNDSSV